MNNNNNILYQGFMQKKTNTRYNDNYSKQQNQKISINLL